jgi:hypothetical protein
MAWAPKPPLKGDRCQAKTDQDCGRSQSQRRNNGKTRGHRLHGFLFPSLSWGLRSIRLFWSARGARGGKANRVADAITAFAGSMLFVYVHVIWFGCWIGFGVEDYPFGLLTMIVSLRAIFLSTFMY